jgi:hypothetical protein
MALHPTITMVVYRIAWVFYGWPPSTAYNDMMAAVSPLSGI